MSSWLQGGSCPPFSLCQECWVVFPHSLDRRESACSMGDLGSIPGLERSPGEGQGNPLQYSCLENPHEQRSLVGYSPWGRKESDMTEQPSRAQECRVVHRFSLGCIWTTTGAGGWWWNFHSLVGPRIRFSSLNLDFSLCPISFLFFLLCKLLFFKTFYFVLGYSSLTNNVVIVLDEQQRDSAVHIHVSTHLLWRSQFPGEILMTLCVSLGVKEKLKTQSHIICV